MQKIRTLSLLIQALLAIQMVHEGAATYQVPYYPPQATLFSPEQARFEEVVSAYRQLSLAEQRETELLERQAMQQNQFSNFRVLSASQMPSREHKFTTINTAQQVPTLSIIEPMQFFAPQTPMEHMHAISLSQVGSEVTAARLSLASALGSAGLSKDCNVGCTDGCGLTLDACFNDCGCIESKEVDANSITFQNDELYGSIYEISSQILNEAGSGSEVKGVFFTVQAAPTPCPDCPIVEPCPECPKIQCPDCNTAELEHYRLVFNKHDTLRSVAAAGNEFLLARHKIITQDVNLVYDIVTAEYLGHKVSYTVQTIEGDHSNLITLYNMEGFENAQYIKYFYGGEMYIVYAIVDRHEDGDTSVTFVEPDNFEILGTVEVVSTVSSSTVSGYTFTVKKETPSTSTSQIVDNFVDENSNVAERERTLISVVQHAAEFIHKEQGRETPYQWAIEVVSYGNIVSQFVVHTVTEDFEVGFSYATQASLETHYTNYYKVEVADASVSTHVYVVVEKTDKEHTFNNAVIDGNQVLHVSTTTVTYGGHYYWVISTASSYEDTDTDFQNNIDQVVDNQDRDIVADDSVAAAAALSRWALERNWETVELVTITADHRQAIIQIQSLGLSWNTQATQIQYGSQSSLYAVTVTHSNGNEVGYYVYVNNKGENIYDVSILHNGVEILITYRIQLRPIHGTAVTEIVVLYEGDSTENEESVKEYEQIIGPSTKPEVVDETSSSTNEVNVEVTEKEKGTGTITHTKEVYEHPKQPGKYYYVDGNNVIDASTGKVISTGGWKALMLLFEGSVTTVPENGSEIFTYDLTGESWKIDSNGKVTRIPGGEHVTDGGLINLLRIITRRDDITDSHTGSYTQYKVNGIEAEFRVWNDGRVTQVPDDHTTITTGGYQGLIDYLTNLLSTEEPKKGDYVIAVDERTGTHYFIYPDGTVTLIDGTFVTDGGIDGLNQYLLTQVLDISIQITHPQYYEVHTSNGLTFRLYFNDDVTDDKGNFICSGGMQCLNDYLKETFGEHVTPGTPERVTYQTFTYDGVKYRIDEDGNVTRDDDGTFITDGGIPGFEKWLIEQNSKETTETTSYQIAVDKVTGDKYHIYPDGKVTTEDGKEICRTGGIKCLEDYLYGKHDDGTHVIQEDEKKKTMTVDHKVYKDRQGDQFYLDPKGYWHDTNAHFIYVFYPSWISTLDYIKTESITIEQTYWQYGVEGTDDKYIVSADGSVWSDNNLIVNGGVQGLIQYLDVKKLADITITKTSDSTSTWFVNQINKGWERNNVHHYFVDHEKSNDKFCDEDTAAQSDRCFYAWLANFYHTQIISTTSQPSYEVVIDGEGIVYHIYEDGVVTDSDGKIICLTGGIDCLYEYLANKYDTSNPDVDGTSQPETSGTVNIFYYKYTDKSGVNYKYYLNGTLVNTKTGDRHEGYNAIKVLQDSLNHIGDGSEARKILYELIKIQGYDDKHEQNALYSIWNDGSIWYNFKYFVDFGDIDHLINIILLKKDLKITQTNSNIYVKEIDETFTIKYNPDRLFNGKGEEICRKNGFEGLYHCLLAYLTNNHFDEITSPVTEVAYERYIIDGVEYKVYPDGKVVDPKGTTISTDGVSGLIEYLFNLERPVRYEGRQTIEFIEQLLVYKSATGKEYLQDGTGNLVDGSTGADANHLKPQIDSGDLTHTGFRQFKETIDAGVLYDSIYDQYYLVHPDDWRVFDLNLRQVSNGGISGFLNWRQTYYNTHGIDYEGQNRVVFEEFGNLTFTIDDSVGYEVIGPSGDVLVIPRADRVEALFLLHEHLYQLGYFQLKHDIYYLYSVYSDKSGAEYRVYNDYGIVITEDSLEKTICSSGGLNCLKNFLNTNKLHFVENDWYEVYETSDGRRFAIFYVGGEVYTYPSLDTKVCEASLDPKGCLTNHLNGQPSPDLTTDYVIYEFNGVKYNAYNDGKVTLNKDDTVICETGGYDCLLDHIGVIEPVSEEGGYSVFRSPHLNTVYRVYNSGTVTTEVNGKEGEVIDPTGGYQALWDHVVEQMNIKKTEVITLDDGSTYHIHPDGSVTAEPQGNVICKTGGKTCLNDWLKQNDYQLYSFENTVFQVFNNGTVKFYPTGEILCLTGGLDCINEYAKDNTYDTYVTPDYTFYIYHSGRSTFENGTEVCATGGKPCVDAFLESLKPKFDDFTLDGRTFEIYPNGTVIETTGGKRETVCITGGYDCAYELVRPSFDTVKYEDYTFLVYSNGKVTLEDGTVICETGGQACLNQWILDNIPQPVIYTVDGIDHHFNFYEGTGKVTDEDGNVICETGGIACLEKWVLDNIPVTVTYTIEKKDYDFDYYQGTGKVTDKEGNVICATGGIPCLEQWLKDNIPTTYKTTVDGEPHTYKIYEGTGKVTDENGNVICETGGKACLDNHIASLTPQTFQVQTGDLTYKFKIYPDGRVTDTNGNVICATGGSDCLNTWIENNIPLHHIHVDDKDYYIFPNGTVIDENTKLVCKSGGLSCLQVTVEYEELVYELYDGEYVIRLRLFENGYVDTDDGEFTTICETGGRPCADQYIIDNYPETVVLKGDTYYLYLDGHSTDANGNIICETGGRPCLEEWVRNNVPDTVVYNVDGKELTFEVYGNGKVVDGDGNVICTTGGQACLDEHIKELTAGSYEVTSGDMVFTFKVYSDGKVKDRNGDIICATGGADCLNKYIEDHIPQHYLHVDGNYYYIYPGNGTVIDSNFNLVCETGGIDCLYVTVEYEELVYELYDGEYTVKLRLFENGYVDTDDGKYTTICETEGRPCADQYVIDNYPETVTLLGDKYYLYLDGRSTDAEGNVICETGGRPCLEDWVNNNIYTLYTVDLEGSTQEFRVYEGTGKVVDGLGNVICETGGKPCLDAYIHNNTPTEYRVESGKMIFTFKVYPDGRVKDRNDDIICNTGGVDCMNAYIADHVPEYYKHIDGKEYYIYPINGTVIDFDFNLVCETGGIECLLTAQPYEELVYELYDGEYVVKLRLFENGYVDTDDGKYTKICDTEGRPCADQYVIDNYPETVVLNGDTYYLYLDGRSTDANGNVICATGGRPCLEEWVRNNVPIEVTVNIEGVDHKFTINEGTGQVWDSDGNLICNTGGEACLNQWIIDNSYKTVTYSANGVDHTFKVYNSGKVVDSNGNVICETGGELCLQQWIFDNLPTEVTYTVKDQTLTFNIYGNGKVTDSKGNVICATGGQDCLNDYIYRISAEDVEIKTGDLVYKYKVYPDGVVTDEFGTVVICETGGMDCLSTYVENHIPQHHLHIDGLYYYIYKNGTVLDSETNLVCSTGGLDCLVQIQPYEELVYELYDGQVVVKLRLFQNGYVDTDDGAYTTICETGGRACADQYIIDTYPETISFNGKNYYLYLDGRSTDADGNIICETGGMDCLYNWLLYNYYETVQMQIGPFIWDFQVFSYGNGSVYDEDWNLICESGGIECLKAWGAQQTPVEYTHEGVKYYLFPSGTSYDQYENVICETGGEKCLLDYFGSLTDQEYVYNIDGHTYTFVVEPSGKVYVKETGQVICETGGKTCLDDFLAQILPTEYTYTHQGVTYKFNIYNDGRVTDENGNVVCVEGGQLCLEKYLEDNSYMLGTYEQYIYKIDGLEYIFNSYTDGRVISVPAYEIICQTGGFDCLDAYVRENLVVPHTAVTYTINNEQVIFYIFDDGRVLNEELEIICESGGQACLENYIQVEYYEEVIYQIDGEAYYFWVFTNQTVTTEHATDVICVSGGKACLEQYVYDNLVPAGVSLFMNGVEQVNKVQSTGKFSWLIAGLLLVLALYVCLILYKKQQQAGEKKQQTVYLRESLLTGELKDHML